MVNEPFLLFWAGIRFRHLHFDQVANGVRMQPDCRDTKNGSETAIVLNEIETFVTDLYFSQVNHVLARVGTSYGASDHESMHFKVKDVCRKHGISQRKVLFLIKLKPHVVWEYLCQIRKNLPLKRSIKFHYTLSRGRSVVWKRKATAFEGASIIECRVVA